MTEDAIQIGVLQETEVLDDGGDATTVRLIGERGTVDVRMTDRSVTEFVGVVEGVFDDRHADVPDREDEFNVHPDDVDDVEALEERRDR